MARRENARRMRLNLAPAPHPRPRSCSIDLQDPSVQRELKRLQGEAVHHDKRRNPAQSRSPLWMGLCTALLLLLWRLYALGVFGMLWRWVMAASTGDAKHRHAEL